MDNLREIVLDTETTGLDPEKGDRIIEIGCVELLNKVRTGRSLQLYFNPERSISPEAFKVHGISDEFLKDKPLFAESADVFAEFIKDAFLIIHNAAFDIKFLNYEFRLLNMPSIKMEKVIDTLLLSKKKFPGEKASLDALCRKFDIDLSQRSKHGALLDAELLASVYVELCGGMQTKFNFLTEPRKNNPANLNKKKKWEKRSFIVSEIEIENHKKFIEQIRNNIWAKNHN